MKIVFVGGDSGSGGSPRLYRDVDAPATGLYVQGYVPDPAALEQMDTPAGENVTFVPLSLFQHLPEDVRGLIGP